MSCSFKIEDGLSENLERFWKLEGYGCDEIRELSADEKYCEQHFVQTTMRTGDGRFIVRLPLRKNLPIGRNKDIALRRLYQLERKFKRNEVFHERYVKFMFEYIELGHMSIVTEPHLRSENVVYLPHHGVLKESSSSTKLRVVFDASARNNLGASLNDALPIGPALQDNLIDIIIRFRFHEVAMTADLQKMYRQVLVHPADRDWQRILWRFQSEEPVKEYQLNTVTYGQACASYLAVRRLRQLATEGSERYPLASRALLYDTYVDDIISGTSTVEDAQVLQEQLTLLLAEGGFKAHKWCSNSENALQNVPTDLRESSNLNIDTNDVIRTLGIEWNPISDEFQFTAQVITSASTKREILSAISKLFDPLGLVGPVLTTAKIFMQGLWKVKADWDEPLPEAVLCGWRGFQTSLRDIKMLRISRSVGNSFDKGQVYLHGFCDASENAYGACIYVQLIRSVSSEISCMLLCSKARVAPLKKQSIPRLELCSALLLARLISNVRRAVVTRIDGILAWSDSMVVLHWLNGEPSRWRPFVSHRTTEIIEVLPTVHWKHVKGQENPADLISRGVTPAQLRESSLWWHGPGWLSKAHPSNGDEETHSRLNDDELTSIKLETKKETRTCNLNLHPSSMRETIDELVQNCSILTKIERSLAYCLRFASNCRKRDKDRLLGRLTLPELMKARHTLIKHSQGTYFQEDLRSLLNKDQLHQVSCVNYTPSWMNVASSGWAVACKKRHGILTEGIPFCYQLNAKLPA